MFYGDASDLGKQEDAEFASDDVDVRRYATREALLHLHHAALPIARAECLWWAMCRLRPARGGSTAGGPHPR